MRKSFVRTRNFDWRREALRTLRGVRPTALLGSGLLATGLLVVGDCSKAVAEVSDKEFEQLMARYLDSASGRENIGKALETYVKEAQQKRIDEAKKQQQEEQEKYFKDPIRVDIGKSPVRGPANAKITIFEFSDFECPYCKRGAETVEKILKEYPNDVKLVFKNLPLSFHKNARSAAQAALAAGKQGKFWEFHDELFKNQQGLGEAQYLEIAKKLKLDEAMFKKDMQSEEISKMIDEETAVANKLSFQGTPGFVVGGVPVRGAYPFEHFKAIIDRLLEKTQQ